MVLIAADRFDAQLARLWRLSAMLTGLSPVRPPVGGFRRRGVGIRAGI
jgi:hypothetical protein